MYGMAEQVLQYICVLQLLHGTRILEKMYTIIVYIHVHDRVYFKGGGQGAFAPPSPRKFGCPP